MKTYVHDNNSLKYSYNMKCIRQICKEIKTHFLQSITFWRDNVFVLGVLMENKGEILHCNTGKRNRQI
jgi:hypothetical protein